MSDNQITRAVFAGMMWLASAALAGNGTNLNQIAVAIVLAVVALGVLLDKPDK